MKKTRSRTELQFEGYLREHGIDFEYEPYKDGGKNPDYRFTLNGARVLVEIEEMDETPMDQLDELVQQSPTHTVERSSDPRDFFNQIREKIHTAARQLKPRRADADICIALIGKKNTSWPKEVDSFNITHAMYGDLAVALPLPIEGPSRSELKQIALPNGRLRRYDPKQGGLIAQHNYISGVATIREYRPYEEYKARFNKKVSAQLDPKLTLHQKFKVMQQSWIEHQPHIPEYARDPEGVHYRLVLVENVNSTKPLSPEVFDYPSDEYHYFPNQDTSTQANED